MHSRSECLPGIAACLADLDAIAAAYVRQVRTLTGYADSIVDDDDLHRTARTTLRLLFEMIQGEDRLAELQEYSERIGRRRALQQVPLESLLRAVRMDFPFIWEALSARTDGGAAALSEAVAWIWSAVERHTTNVQAGYLDEMSRVNAELELERTFLLRQLLSEDTGDPQLHRQAAAALGLPADGEYLVVVSGDLHPNEFGRLIRNCTPRVVLLRLEGVEFAILLVDALTREAEQLLLTIPAGVSVPATGLSEVAGMWRLARELSTWAEPGRAATLERHWDKIAAHRLGAIGTAYAKKTLADLTSMPPRDREALTDTLRIYLDTGSIAETAGRLYCHRHTVINRLARVNSSTGLDPAIPRDAGALHLLLAIEAAGRVHE
ncbi:helix-turn-helix domain-containing protein [Mycobacterium sp. ITM-2016-00317]|uniref:PucR family transcriptional regulator n=1 Tax=Mycobacterium sp. ITM-2016-00317 TaxID=2099694 RepID=UPI000D44FF42|nr:PucR family transcriptional regulator [Mycobacterium sp. ITM-2016-00317]WNG85343.1 helix-turn-helix domain-containing protein [Mycobacterium sp. ITM-2016-00317]